MKKIGTHNSGTGERPGNLLSWLGWPFARCQGKTLREQYEAGARYFDLRAAWRDGEWRCAHGLWTSRRTLADILTEINGFAEPCKVILTYEGGDDEPNFIAFRAEVEDILRDYLYIQFQYFAVKWPKWRIWKRVGKNYPVQGFVPIEGWRRLLPVPWVWYFVRSLRYRRVATFGASAPTFGAGAPTEETKKWVLVDFL